MPLPQQRPGAVLKIKRREMDFTLWPMRRGTRRYGLQSRVFVSNPWTIIKQAIEDKCPMAAKLQAIAFCEQAEDYFYAAKSATTVAAKPVLLYYCILNFAKAFVLTRSGLTQYAAAYHGLAERLAPGGSELIDAFLQATPSGRSVNVFDDFLKIISPPGLTTVLSYQIKHLMPQILQGHRLWCEATDEQERFIQISKIEFMHDSANKNIWLNIFIRGDDLRRISVSRRKLLQLSRLSPLFREVTPPPPGGPNHIFEQTVPVSYTHRPSDNVKNLIDVIKNKIWVNVYSVPPYKTYYLYLAPPTEHPYVLPQMLSVHALVYYFGSVTRYRPHIFNEF